jgi:hypothetical protein
MTSVARRSFVKSLLGCAPFAVMPEMRGERHRQATSGKLNFHVSGPFVFLYFSKRILILSPNPADHLGPYLTTLTSESDLLQPFIYELVGPTANAIQPAPTAIGGIASQRLAIPASALQLDTMGTIDSAHNRYFALWVPMPKTIVPWHPVHVTVSGADSPLKPAPMDAHVPVGYTLVYDNVTFASVQVNNLGDSKQNWNPNLVPLPDQNYVDVALPMEPSLKQDCCHASALAAFGKKLDLLMGINQKPRLDIAIRYTDDPASCAEYLAETIHHAGEDCRGPRTHPGHDCKAALLEIDGVSDNVTIG